MFLELPNGNTINILNINKISLKKDFEKNKQKKDKPYSLVFVFGNGELEMLNYKTKNEIYIAKKKLFKLINSNKKTIKFGELLNG